jgi:hypothetical protein
MKPLPKSVIVPATVVLALAAVYWIWFRSWSPWQQPGPNPPVASVIAVNDFDAFQKSLAERVSQRFSVDPGSVVIAPAAYDLGWLLDAEQTYPADSTDCVPAPIPAALAAPHLFPSYRLNSSTASSMTLGSDALQQVSQASLNLSHQANLVYSIDQVQVLLIDMKTVDRLSHSGDCGSYIAQHPKTRLIRGLVLGKISFSFSTDNPISAQAKLPKLGGISANGDPNNSTVTVADEQPSQILEMVSILQNEPQAAAPQSPQGASASSANVLPDHSKVLLPPPSPAPSSLGAGLGGSTASLRPTRPMPGMVAPDRAAIAPLPALQPRPAAVAPGTPHIFLQQDRASPAGQYAAIASRLQQAWSGAVVESAVQRMPSAKMPSMPQVRFFRATDQNLANTCRDLLKASSGIDARIVRVGLNAPAGQLEIWLPANVARN